MRPYVLILALALSFAGSTWAQSVPAFQNRDQGGSQGSGNAELFFMIQQLQEEVRELRGMVETQQHQLDRLSKQSKDRYIDLDQRLLELSKRVSTVGQSASPAPSTSANGAAQAPEQADGNGDNAADTAFRQPSDEEKKAYAEIQKLIKEDKYDPAIDRIYDFLSDFEQGDLTVNAYYWLGELYLVQDNLEQAKQAFTVVTARYPAHRKAPDAAFKMGVALQRQGNASAAKQQYQDVMNQYPDSNAADLAKKRLAEL